MQENKEAEALRIRIRSLEAQNANLESDINAMLRIISDLVKGIDCSK